MLSSNCSVTIGNIALSRMVPYHSEMTAQSDKAH